MAVTAYLKGNESGRFTGRIRIDVRCCTKRTCRGRLTMSAPEGKTDVPRERGHFRFWTHNGHRPACHAAEAKPLQPLSMDQMRHYDAMSRAWGTSWPRQLLLVSPPQCRKRKSIANPIAVTR